MSRIFSKLKDLPQQRSAEAMNPADLEKEAASELKAMTTASVSKIRHFSIFIILCNVAAFWAVFFLGSLSSNIAQIKNNIFFSMDESIQHQQNQLLLLTKNFDAVQSSTKVLNKGMQAKVFDINSILESKINQTSINMDHMEAILQANIDELNIKLNKLQSSMPTFPKTGDHT